MKKPDPKTKTVEPARKGVLGKIEPIKAPAGAAAVVAEPKEKKPPFNPMKFIAEVRQEARKITWTTRKETWITTVMVLIMVVLAGVFFFVVDSGLGALTHFLTDLGQNKGQ